MQFKNTAFVVGIDFPAEKAQSEPKKKSLRGFASMNRERQRAIARMGGKIAHEKGTAHEFTPEEARVAGRKGGVTVSRDREHMALIGREGGQARRREASKSSEPVGWDEAPPEMKDVIDVTPGIID